MNPHYETVRKLHDEHAATLINFAANILYSRELAEDTVADVFVKLLEKLPSFKDKDHERATLFVYTKNACIDRLRKNDAIDPLPDDFESSPLSAFDLNDTEEAEMNRHETIERIYQAIDQLPESWKLALKARFKENLSNKEIAQKYNMPEGAVRKYISKGLSRVKEILIRPKGKWRIVKALFIVIPLIVNLLKAIWHIYQYILFHHF